MHQSIEHVCEPNRLLLTWQSPNLDGVRKRFGVADLFRHGDNARLVYRDDSDVEEARALGYAGYPAFRLREQTHYDALPPFMRRLPPRDRSDFSRYLALFGISDASLSSFSLLGYTEAKLPTDGFALVSELDSACVPSEHLLEIAGFRHYPNNYLGISVNDDVDIGPEPDNPHDPDAVKITYRGRKIGNINRYQAKTFLHWLGENNVSAVLARLNGTADRPRAYVFVSVR